MKSAWNKNNLRELKKTLGRFFAMVSIVALGVGFFIGLKSSRPAMVQTCKHYLDDMNFYDLQLISSVGFDDDAASLYETVDGVQAAEGGFSAPMLVNFHDQELVFQAHRMTPTINQLTVTAGRLPEAPNECLADDLAIGPELIGQELTVVHQEDSPFSQDAYTIVGVGHSPQYLNYTRGGTSLGNGTLTGFLFIPPEGFDVDYCTEIFLRLEGDREPFTTEYIDHLKEQEDVFLPLMEVQGEERLDHILDDARTQLDEGWDEYMEGAEEFQSQKKEVNEQLDEAKEQLDQAKQDLLDGEQALKDGEAQLQQLIMNPYSTPELAEARRMLDDGKAQYQAGLMQYEQGKTMYEQSKGAIRLLISTAEQGLISAQEGLSQAQAQHQLAQDAFDAAEAQVRAQQETLYAPVAQLEQELRTAEADLAQKQAYLDSLSPLDPQYIGAQLAVSAAETEVQLRRSSYETAKAAYDTQAAIVESQLQEARSRLEQTQIALDQAQALVTQFQTQLEDGKQQMRDLELEMALAEQQLTDAKAQIDAGERELQNQIQNAIASGQQSVADGKQQLEDGRKQYDEGYAEWVDGKRQAYEEFSKAEKDLDKAYRDLQQAELDLKRMDDPSYYVMTPVNNNGYASFDNDSQIIASIADVFPLFFFLVAALVCSSTMTRMVEEQRTQNGTLKALGYSDFRIMTRYAGYAALAAVVGVGFGILIGAYLFPFVIWTAYKLLYHFGEIEYIFQWHLVAIALAAALLCCVGAACAAAWNDLKQMPAALMRPKAPKAGKRIFLEYIKPLWNHMSFLAKVSFRNIFRYKKRLFMMILGTAGCLALLITGLGLKDSISQVADDQYDVISLHDFMITFSAPQTEEEQKAFRTEFGGKLDTIAFTSSTSLNVPTPKGNKDVNLVATNDPNMDAMTGLYWEEQDLGYPTGDGMYLSHGLAEDLGLQVGDTLPVILESKDKIEIPISGIFTNYVFHAAYMTADGYRTWFGIEPEIKTAYATSAETDLDALSAELQNFEGVVNVMPTQDIRDIVDDSMQSLDAVVALVVACASALSFVVSYNLININITERVREIATIKVLGFYRKETYVYVFRETLILTFLGILVGIPLGIWLHGFIMNAVSIDFVEFQIKIAPLSFVIAVILTILVTVLVNTMLSKKIDKINMAESLKSVE